MKKISFIYKNLDAKSMLEWRRKEADTYLNLVRNVHQLLFIHRFKSLRKKRRILEYGCAFGDLLAMIKTLNPRHKVYGVEVVKGIADIAGDKIGGKSVFNKSCEQRLPLKSDSIDIIFSLDMIEHVPSKKKIKKMFKENNRLLKKSGVCITVTPNCNWIMKFIYFVTGNVYLIDKKFHPNQYNMKALKEEVGSELNIIKAEKGYDLNIFTRVLSWIGIYKHLCVVAGKK